MSRDVNLRKCWKIFSCKCPSYSILSIKKAPSRARFALSVTFLSVPALLHGEKSPRVVTFQNVRLGLLKWRRKKRLNTLCNIPPKKKWSDWLWGFSSNSSERSSNLAAHEAFFETRSCRWDRTISKRFKWNAVVGALYLKLLVSSSVPGCRNWY